MPFASSRRRANVGLQLQFLGPCTRAAYNNKALWSCDVLSKFHSVRSVTPDHWHTGMHFAWYSDYGWWVEYQHLIHGVGLSAVHENEMQQTARNEDTAYITHMLQHVLHIEKLTNGLVDTATMSMRVANLLRNYPPRNYTPQHVIGQRLLHLRMDMRACLLDLPPTARGELLGCYGGYEQALPGLDVNPRQVLFREEDPEDGLQPEWVVGPDQKHRCMIIKANPECTVGIDLTMSPSCQIPRDEIVVKRMYFSEFDLLNPMDVLFEDGHMETVETDDLPPDFLLEELVIPPANGQLIRGVYLHFHSQRYMESVLVEKARMMQIHGEGDTAWTLQDDNDGEDSFTFPDMPYLVMVVDDRMSEYMSHLDTTNAIVLGTHKRVGAASLFTRWEIGIEIIAHILRSLEPQCFEAINKDYLKVLKDAMEGKIPVKWPDTPKTPASNPE